MGPASRNIGMNEGKNQKIQFEYFAGKSDFLLDIKYNTGGYRCHVLGRFRLHENVIKIKELASVIFWIG